MVLTTISVLYLLSFVDFIFQWYFLDWAFVANGDTRDSIFGASLGGPLWLQAIDQLIQNASIVVADVLLVGLYP